MRKTTVLEKVARFLTGKTPGLQKASEESCKRASDRISESDRKRANASVNFRRAQSELSESIEDNVELNATAFLMPPPKKA